MTELDAFASPLGPFLSGWTRPRATIRYLVERGPTRATLALAAVGGVVQTMARSLGKGLADDLELLTILAIIAAIGAITGIVGVYLMSVLFEWTGRWIGGRATRGDLRTALAWTNVPMTPAFVLGLIMVALVGKLPFLSDLSSSPAPIPGWHFLVLFAYSATLIVSSGWAVVVGLKMVGEVQGFSAWKALGNSVLAMALLLVPLLVTVVIAVLIPG